MEKLVQSEAGCKDGAMEVVGVLLLNRIYIPTITIEFIKPLLFGRGFSEYWAICFCYWLVECRADDDMK